MTAGAERDQAIARSLCAWFEASARDLPWRRTRDPYAIWLSEIMLQQTRVDTVVPYYERFLWRYPDADSLARAEVDDVLSMWSGLGYYRRARELHAAAREVVERYGGKLPSEASELRKLPGIGAYTAGAISSIAFGRAEALVDGNVARVLSRIEGIEDDVRSVAGGKRLWATAARLVPADKPGMFNESLMELGATICTPRDPACGACPVRFACEAARTGRQNELPVVRARAKVPVVKMVAAVVRHGREVLFARRAEGGLFGGLWEAPMVEAGSLAAAGEALRGAGIEQEVQAALRKLGKVRHILSHRELDVLVAGAEARSRYEVPALSTAPYERAAWLDPDAAGVGISTLARKVLEAAPADPPRPARGGRTASGAASTREIGGGKGSGRKKRRAGRGD
ncbi:MAG TPA: A/G-specific adenine glycosylase [Polyangiaceae bacterium]|jgi:A/G-specific adenine glycosylase|nr:A/G-specific adenine glycosylase [Polyangiaceae bacterium]